MKTGTEIYDTHFEDESWEGERLRDMIVEDTTFVNCRLISTDLSGSIFRDCTFERCEILNPGLSEAAFQNVRFVDSKLLGMDFGDLRKRMLELSFQGCKIDLCQFVDLQLEGLKLTHCRVAETGFANCKLQKADFSESDLMHTQFEQCDLRRSDFRTARNYRLDPLQNRLMAAKMSLPEALSLLEHLGIDLA